MKRLAIIGANEFQSELIKKAKAFGYETHVFSWGGGEPGEYLADYFYKISIVDKENILEKCREIGIDGICSIASDLANITVHWVARHLNLKHHSFQCINATTNKYFMRETLRKNNVPIPNYQLVSSYNDLDINKVVYPSITKPIDRSGSRGINRVDSCSALETAIADSLSESFSKQVLVEEFIEGEEFSVESFSIDGKHHIVQITQKITTGSPNYIEVAHFSPPLISSEICEKIKKVTKLALDTLYVKSGPSHTEIKVNMHSQPIVIEVGSRMGGDFIGSFIVPHNTGIDLVGLTIKDAMNFPICKEELKAIERESTTFVYYQIDPSYPDLLKNNDLKLLEKSINTTFTLPVRSSAQRYSCSKFEVPKEKVIELVNFIESINK